MGQPRTPLVFLGGLAAGFSAVLAAGLAWGQTGAPAAEQDGWRDLVVGEDLAGWQDASGGRASAGWVVEEGALVRKERAGDVWTKERFGNFVLDLEFKTEGNSGVFIRTDNPRDCVQTGIEIQVYTPVKNPTKGSCGAIYNCVAPAKEASRAGEWNHLRITAADNKLTVAMNGEEIADMDLDQWTEPGKNPDGTKNKFRTALRDFKREGHVGFQDHGAWVAYRNIRIQPLNADR